MTNTLCKDGERMERSYFLKCQMPIGVLDNTAFAELLRHCAGVAQPALTSKTTNPQDQERK